MRDVYSGAVITIIASESPTTRSGIHSSRPRSICEPCQLLWGQQGGSFVWLRPSFRNAVDASYTNQLQTRGWTLQEGLLAPRTLSFRKDQMVWECSNYRRTESGHTILLDHMFDSKDLFHNKTRKNKSSLIYQDVCFRLYRQVAGLENRKSRIGWLPKYIVSSGVRVAASYTDSTKLHKYSKQSFFSY